MMQFGIDRREFEGNPENYGKNSVSILGVAADSRRLCNLELGNQRSRIFESTRERLFEGYLGYIE